MYVRRIFYFGVGVLSISNVVNCIATDTLTIFIEIFFLLFYKMQRKQKNLTKKKKRTAFFTKKRKIAAGQEINVSSA